MNRYERSNGTLSRLCGLEKFHSGARGKKLARLIPCCRFIFFFKQLKPQRTALARTVFHFRTRRNYEKIFITHPFSPRIFMLFAQKNTWLDQRVANSHLPPLGALAPLIYFLSGARFLAVKQKIHGLRPLVLWRFCSNWHTRFIFYFVPVSYVMAGADATIFFFS